ncbi:MAG: glycosyltransferase family 25 protein [Elusimicrobiota bacterium]|jgi:glycosyl transferase family 25|nr:glycosyltransferase family 25 protein [Elusimicrobiota bacterium]
MAKGIQGFVIHLSTDEERGAHMRAQIKGLAIPVHFILEGDAADLTPEILEKYFTGDLKAKLGVTSCTYKHLRALEEMTAKNIPYGLIFENDIFLTPDFEPALHAAIAEIEQKNITNFLLSLEDSNLRYVPGSQRRKGQLVYPRDIGRFAGAYLLDLPAARNILKEVAENKCELIIDSFHTHCGRKGLINFYWLHPTIATQGSHNGKIANGISKKAGNIFRRISFETQRVYKKILWRFR